jgi:hypothetical protein
VRRVIPRIESPPTAKVEWMSRAARKWATRASVLAMSKLRTKCRRPSRAARYHPGNLSRPRQEPANRLWKEDIFTLATFTGSEGIDRAVRSAWMLDRSATSAAGMFQNGIGEKWPAG